MDGPGRARRARLWRLGRAARSRRTAGRHRYRPRRPAARRHRLRRSARALAVTVTDSAGRPAPGVEVSWEASGGTRESADGHHGRQRRRQRRLDAAEHVRDATRFARSCRARATCCSPRSRSRSPAPSRSAISMPAAITPAASRRRSSCSAGDTTRTASWGSAPPRSLRPRRSCRATTATAGSSGASTTPCAITLAAEAWCWGNNGDDRLGDGATATQSLVPTPVLTAQVFDTVVNDTIVLGQVRLLVQEMSAGEAHTCGINLSQRIWCWGRNREGQLGKGTVSDFFPPSPLATTEVYKHVAVGGLHTCALTLAANADAQCWGYNRVRAARERHHCRRGRSCDRERRYRLAHRSARDLPEPRSGFPAAGGAIPGRWIRPHLRDRAVRTDAVLGAERERPAWATARPPIVRSSHRRGRARLRGRHGRPEAYVRARRQWRGVVLG